MNEVIDRRGKCYVVFMNGSLEIITQDVEAELPDPVDPDNAEAQKMYVDKYNAVTKYHVQGELMDGKDYAMKLFNCIITPHNTKVVKVFIDGYESNMGMYFVDSNHKVMIFGGTLLDLFSWIKTCKYHHILVDVVRVNEGDEDNVSE